MAKSYGMQYLSGSDSLDMLVIDDLAELDQKLSELIKKGEKVVLLGDQVWVDIFHMYNYQASDCIRITDSLNESYKNSIPLIRSILNRDYYPNQMVIKQFNANHSLLTMNQPVGLAIRRRASKTVG